MVSRARKLFPRIQQRLSYLGFHEVEVTGEEKDSLNSVINEKKPELLLVGSGFYQAATPYMMGELVERFPKLNMAALSVCEYPDDIAVWFIWHGVKSYLNLWEGYEEFHRGLQEVRQGKAYISPKVRDLMELFSEWPDTKNRVTKRQMEVLILICNGFIPEHIGDRMHISRATVNYLLQKMYDTFHVKNREELVKTAFALKLVSEEDLVFYDRERKAGALPEWAVVRRKIKKRKRGALNGD